MKKTLDVRRVLMQNQLIDIYYKMSLYFIITIRERLHVLVCSFPSYFACVLVTEISVSGQSGTDSLLVERGLS